MTEVRNIIKLKEKERMYELIGDREILDTNITRKRS
jgi:hypothetical protein